MKLSHGILGLWIESIQAGETKLGTPRLQVAVVTRSVQGDCAEQRAETGEETWPLSPVLVPRVDPGSAGVAQLWTVGPPLSSEYCTSLNADKAVGLQEDVACSSW